MHGNKSGLGCDEPRVSQLQSKQEQRKISIFSVLAWVAQFRQLSSLAEEADAQVAKPSQNLRCVARSLPKSQDVPSTKKELLAKQEGPVWLTDSLADRAWPGGCTILLLGGTCL